MLSASYHSWKNFGWQTHQQLFTSYKNGFLVQAFVFKHSSSHSCHDVFYISWVEMDTNEKKWIIKFIQKLLICRFVFVQINEFSVIFDWYISHILYDSVILYVQYVTQSNSDILSANLIISYMAVHIFTLSVALSVLKPYI